MRRSEEYTMKKRSLWKLLYFWGVVMPLCIAAPVDVSSVSDNDATTGPSWLTGAFLTVAGLAVLIKLVAMCACGEKPTSDATPDANQPPPVQLLSQQSNDNQNEASTQQPHSPPLPTTPNGASYQNMPEKGTGQHSPKKDNAEGTSGASTSPQITRTATIDRQLPAIPPINKGRPSMDYDDDYDTIKDSRKEEDYDGTYARVKENKKVITTIDETEGDYADVPDVRRRVMPDDFGEYAAVTTEAVKRSTSESRPEMVKTPAVAPERIAPRAESEDISDAEYATVDLKQAKGAGPSNSKDDVEPYESVEVGAEAGAAGGAKVPRKNHGYAKIDDVRGNAPGPSGNDSRPEGQAAEEELGAGSSPTRSPRTPPQMSPTHSAGSPSHQQRSLPEIDATATGLPTPPLVAGPPPDGAAHNDPGNPSPQTVEEQASAAQNSNRKEPRYSQVSARESLVRVRARQQQEQLNSGAAVGAEGSLLHYQMVVEETQREEEDHNGYYESVDYQAVEENRSREPYSNTAATSRTLPPRSRGRVYEEINDTGNADQPEGATADIEPYAVVEPLSRRKTAPSRYSAKSDRSEPDHSDLYAKVDKNHKIKRGFSADNQEDGKDFDELYAKVNKKPKPQKIASFDENASDPENEVSSADGLYAEVNKPSSSQRSQARNGTPRNNRDFDDSYQSIDELSAEQSIAKAKEVGMVHIDDVQTTPVVWTRPEHTYASVETDSEQNNSERSSPNSSHRPHRRAHHNYEVVDRKQPPKSNGKDNENAKGSANALSSSTESPTHLDKRQLRLLADKNVKETDL